MARSVKFSSSKTSTPKKRKVRVRNRKRYDAAVASRRASGGGS
jgi:hypothetical protein